ncbi:hypothetical protein HZA99_01235 [Candidatus Woesearchaeota archaeon]|nr:hypothetical protein [Candidatus Woesearchaeota archaeon]
MAKKKMNGEMCESKSCGSCPCWFSWAILVIGVLYLLGDLGIWTWFAATFSWWTVVFLLIGLKKVCKNMM